MGERVETYSALAATIRAKNWLHTGLVAVDGPGGAGKSAFAARLARALGDVAVVHTDDFATGEAGVDWWPRLESDVIEPLIAGRPARVRRRHGDDRMPGEVAHIEAGDVVVIEGVSSARRAIAARLALAIWVHAPRQVRLRRGLQRDGAEAAPEWARWMDEEDVHFAQDETLTRVAVIVNGDPTITHDPEVSFVRLDAAPGD